MPEGDSDYYSKPIHIETGAAKKRDRVRYMFLLFAVLWAGIIFYASSIPADGLPSDLGNLNVLGHFVEYLVLAVLLWFAWKDKWKNTVNYLMVTAAICALYAASDEIHQYFVPGRQTDFLDWVVDVLGAGVGLCGAVAAHIFGGFGLRRR
jgi:VanZ family protein